MERRLAAILATDVVGYSRLMEQDEAGTFARLRAHRKELFEPEIAAHHGRVFKLMGDGLLAEFASVIEAIECAVALQDGMAQRNAAAPSEYRIEVRMGINLGDVIVEQDEAGAVDMHGEGVIIAYRLQVLAEPGGICVSQTVMNHVGHKIAVGFEFIGEQRVKNIAEPVRVYRVLAKSEATGRGMDLRKSPRHPWRWAAAAAAVLLVLIAGGVAAWLRAWQEAPPPAAVEAKAPPLPDRPSIAVLPFASLSKNQEQAYFADGLAEDLMTGLSRLPGLFVIARHSAFAYKEQELDLRKVGRELGVRYIVEGSVQRTGEQVRINIQLVDVSTLGHLWAEKYDGSMADIFVLQDRVTKSVVDALALKLTAGEQQALAGQNETAVPEAYDEFLRGWEHFQRTTPADFAAALPHFERAIALDPTYARAQAGLAMVYFRAYDQRWATSLGMTADAAFGKAREYLKLASAHPTSTSHQVTGNIFGDRGWYDDAVKEFQAAIALDPTDSWSYAFLAYSLIYAGKAAEGETQIETAMRLDPHFPSLFQFYLGLAQFEQNRMEEAAITLEKAVRLNPDDPWPFLFLAASHAYLEREKKATEAIAAFNSVRVKAGGVPLVMRELTGGYDLTSFAPPPGSPLIRGLLRLGVPEDFYEPAFDSVRLKANEVEALFFGHRLHGRMWNGWEYGLSVAADGAAVKSGNWGVGPSTGANTAQLEGDRLCFLSSTTRMCGSVLRNPGGTRTKENEYLWFVGGFVRPFSQIE
jgi:TolB-like protein/class 3 adenylate cyclase/Flp pilus assembly protein TadD